MALNTRMLNDGIKEEDLPVLKRLGEDLARNSLRREGNRERTIQKLSTSQIRKFFGEIKRIQADFDNCKNDIVLLDPKIAYAVGRAKKNNEPSKIEDFYKEVGPLLSEIRGDKQRFKNFVNIIEAIVAYHAEAGGK